jgi:hypothetical protein
VNPFPLWLKPRRRADGVHAPPPRRAGNPEQDAEQRWENEGGSPPGNPPLTEPPDANPRQRF